MMLRIKKLDLQCDLGLVLAIEILLLTKSMIGDRDLLALYLDLDP